MKDDLVHAPAETDQPRSGQLNAVDAAPFVAPDYIYDPEDWEQTFPWDCTCEATYEGPSHGRLKRFSTLMQGPDIFAANVPIAWEADGEPRDHEICWFNTEAEAEAALAASPQREGDRPVEEAEA